MSRARLLLPPGKADLIPVEILSEIFLLTVQLLSGYRRNLMLVCRRWHAIMLSTPGIHSQLTVRRATQKEVVQAFIQGRKSRLDVRVDMNDEKDGCDFNAENFHACLMAAAKAASRWSSLDLISPPPHGEYKALQILQPLVHLRSFKLAYGFNEFLEPLMTAISKSASPNLTTMHLADPAAVLYLVQPTCLNITHSLRILKIQLSKRMGSPVDILPHLQRLEYFEVRHLCLPIYPPDACLPLIHTLRFLYLKSVSVQWMAGHAFPSLKECNIIFPQYADTIQALWPVTLPSCSVLHYNSNNLQPLRRFHLPSLHWLDVKNGQWNAWRGNPHLAALYPIFSAGAQSLTDLRLGVECSEQLLVFMLRSVPALKELWLGLARPTALSPNFFQAFILRTSHADGPSHMVGPPSRAILPLCPSLKSLSLQYKRWLRGPDKKELISVLGDIVESRQQEPEASFSLNFDFDEAVEPRIWRIGNPVKKLPDSLPTGLQVGISTPHAIIPLSIWWHWRGCVPLPFKEIEYFQFHGGGPHNSIEFLFIRDHTELGKYNHDIASLPAPLPCSSPPFNTLRVLVVVGANPSFLAGRTFHKLERCRLVKRVGLGHIPNQLLLTETAMPVCTRVDTDDPYLLATFKLPQISQLALDFSHSNFSTIWEKGIAVNANLSGLNLLHMKNWPVGGDLILILRSLPSLETLIISFWGGAISLRAFLPIDESGTSGLELTSREGKTVELLCPRLQSLQIEGGSHLVDQEPIPIFKNIVTLRAMCGSPLKVFTISEILPPAGSKFALIGRDGSFTMERIVLAEGSEGFKLDI
jgi:hypothetical protein